jgi:hypothetical protein
MKKVKKHKRQAWFVPVRKSYLPASWQGFVIYFLYVAYIVTVPIVWYGEGHLLWNLLTEVIPLDLAGVLLAQYIAANNSKCK